MRSPFCAGSYTLWAIFSPLEAERAESVLSRAGSLDPVPSLLLIHPSAKKGILRSLPCINSTKLNFRFTEF